MGTGSSRNLCSWGWAQDSPCTLTEDSTIRVEASDSGDPPGKVSNLKSLMACLSFTWGQNSCVSLAHLGLSSGWCWFLLVPQYPGPCPHENPHFTLQKCLDLASLTAGVEPACLEAESPDQLPDHVSAVVHSPPLPSAWCPNCGVPVAPRTHSRSCFWCPQKGLL